MPTPRQLRPQPSDSPALRGGLRRQRHQGRAGRPRPPASSPPNAPASPTPQPSTPDAVARVLVDLLERFPEADGPVGITVPGVVRHGVVHSAANIDRSWLGTDADALFTKATGRDVHVVNDADAAGLAEVRYGAARGRSGLVLVTTLGTGIGSALVHDGVLVPNAELGHLEIDGHDAEKRAANSAREERGPVLGGSGPSGCRPTTGPWRSCSRPTCSSSAAGSARRPTSSCRCSTSTPRSSPRPCSTRPASSAPRSTRARVAPDGSPARPGPDPAEWARTAARGR